MAEAIRFERESFSKLKADYTTLEKKSKKQKDKYSIIKEEKI
jgi:hypothetical protein